MSIVTSFHTFTCNRTSLCTMSLGSLTVSLEESNPESHVANKLFVNCNHTFILSGAKHLKKINFLAFVFYLCPNETNIVSVSGHWVWKIRSKDRPFLFLISLSHLTFSFCERTQPKSCRLCVITLHTIHLILSGVYHGQYIYLSVMVTFDIFSSGKKDSQREAVSFVIPAVFTSILNM